MQTTGGAVGEALQEDHGAESSRQPRVVHFATPWGVGWFRLANGRLVEISLAEDHFAREAGRGLATKGSEDRTGELHEVSGGEGSGDPGLLWRRRLEAYFEDPRTWSPGNLELDGLGLTRFQRDVYEALLTVPAGETVSYGELARLAGYPGAARAVGSAMAENPLPLVIPCHRVVRSDGSLGRYGRCDALKEHLLRLEGALGQEE